jgi:hypothetical protein
MGKKYWIIFVIVGGGFNLISCIVIQSSGIHISWWGALIHGAAWGIIGTILGMFAQNRL